MSIPLAVWDAFHGLTFEADVAFLSPDPYCIQQGRYVGALELVYGERPTDLSEATIARLSPSWTQLYLCPFQDLTEALQRLGTWGFGCQSALYHGATVTQSPHWSVEEQGIVELDISEDHTANETDSDTFSTIVHSPDSGYDSSMGEVEEPFDPPYLTLT